MNVLVIDTSCDALTIALKVDEKFYSYKSMTERQGHSVSLLPAINNLLEEAGVTVNQIDYFGAIVGPGSFTGIRVGVATVNAFAYANSKKVVAITTFEPFAYDKQATAFAIDAKHGNYYFAQKVDCKLEYETLEGVELKEDVSLLNVTDVEADKMMKIAEEKISLGEYADAIKPFYMRASEAERNKK